MFQFLLCFLIAFAMSIIIAPLLIVFLKKIKAGQNILGYVDNHMSKQGIPTMGGIIFILGTILSALFFINNYVKFAIITLSSMAGYGLLGFLDDFIKIKLKHNLGLRAYQKIIGQLGIALLVAIYIYMSPLCGSDILIPFTFSNFNIGVWIIPFVILVFVAVTNSVNLTDGLDGLASGVSFLYLFGFTMILFIYKNHLENIGEGQAILQELNSSFILCGGFMGALLGYFCFNSNPAKVFMGDTGSLAIGGFIAAICCLTKFYLLIPILGFLFVLSSISVIMQVLYFKATRKRIFLMAPIHHHFERKGIKENKIVAIYMVVTLIIATGCIMLYLI